MVDITRCVAFEVNGEEVSLYQVLRLAKLNGTLQLISDSIDATLIQQAAEQRGIKVSDEELQQAADDFRAAKDLYDAETTQAWLSETKLSYEDWEASLESQVTKEKLRDLLTAEQVEQRFVEQRLSFDQAAVSRLLLADEGVARELRAQIVEDGADFHALARQHSNHYETKPAGGYAGEVLRSDMEPSLEAAVFGAREGDVVGPIKTDDGWELIKVERLLPAQLDVEMRETIKTKLFRDWLDKQRSEARISLPILDPLVDDTISESEDDG